MKEFASILGFVAHVDVMIEAVPEQEETALRKIGERVALRAKEEFGHYQEGASGAAGSVEAWQPLADSTLRGWTNDAGRYYPGKIALGYATEGDHRPLERTGDTRDTVDYAVSTSELTVGSESDVLLAHELGTDKMPPRSVLALALINTEAEAVNLLGLHMMKALLIGAGGE
ncbi:MAG: hypothetical protein JO142_02255 [Burkholderiales bacterium]|nr:hypothetical protein [Burkholderiales bacterium]